MKKTPVLLPRLEPLIYLTIGLLYPWLSDNLFVDPHKPERPQRVAQTIDKGHGRIEVSQITVVEDNEGFVDWPGMRQLFKVEREVKEMKGKRRRKEVEYGLTSCPASRGSARQILEWIRSYWGIENGLHYRRDKTLQEDGTRFSSAKMAAVMATINNFVIGLAQKLGYGNLAEARRVFDWSIACQLRR